MSEPLPLVDAHLHVWDLDRRPQPWLDEPGHEPIRRSHGIEDLRRAADRPLAGRRLTSTVVVQCFTSVAETAELLDLAAPDPLVGAVVGWADLMSPTVGDVLDELRSTPRGGRISAACATSYRASRTRSGCNSRPSSGACAPYRTKTSATTCSSAATGSTRRPASPSASRTSRSCWTTGANRLSDSPRCPSGRARCALARYPQVRCTVSGLITEADHCTWTLDDTRPVWDTLLTAFGPERLMFGSDWPVCVLSGGWTRWAATVEHLLDDCSPHEKQAVLCDTATAFYRLSDHENQK
ncbi:Amidohydrolase [Streptomyces sp. 3213]|nr:Amidohydrolase [Streptomyces sp. 3213] [Streptomyces sp. 3213.3]